MVPFEPTSLLLAPSTVHRLWPCPLPLTASWMCDISPRFLVSKASPWLTPGIRVVSCRKFRPLRGSSRTCSPVTRPATSPPMVFTATAGTSTVTLSVRVPVSSRTFTARSSATFRATPLMVADLNPVSETSTA